MQELEKILEEIENERTDIDDYSDAKGRMLARHWNSCIDVVEEIIRKHLSLEKDPEITKSSRDNEVTECCPHCDSEITVLWNVEQDGYQIFCPNCGETIMLCSMCDREPCDWTENGCKYSDNRYGKRKDGRGKDEADT